MSVHRLLARSPHVLRFEEAPADRGGWGATVVRLAPCPVVAVRACEAPPQPHALKTIVVPLDFSDIGQQALALARRLAEPEDATVLMLHVLEDVIVPDVVYPVGTSLFLREPEARDRAAARMEELFTTAPPPPSQQKTNNNNKTCRESNSPSL